jgi:hypothetical protein
MGIYNGSQRLLVFLFPSDNSRREGFGGKYNPGDQGHIFQSPYSIFLLFRCHHHHQQQQQHHHIFMYINRVRFVSDIIITELQNGSSSDKHVLESLGLYSDGNLLCRAEVKKF